MSNRINPLATIFDKPNMPMGPTPGATQGDEAPQIADLSARVADLEQRVSALEGTEQGEGQEPEQQ